ncbi:hypothetical protein C7I87_29800 [Mesorhizobium sp. SARCC-RB16n]|uniref:hypothetical protein n=1 Tax=Mesorhizobium sp. SARCC-RB16n TaxID=2116687 RepID=UPI00122F8784|nr:hypothetical protein [Mesorhizobium sp. SARCC-RB16n]KAA3446914.1 hypothetical protein C7I87_29800 [Mesorhizobium sp. SARCC-RB16n]
MAETPLPDWTPELRAKILKQAEEVIDGRSIPQMIEDRNETIVGLMNLRDTSRINAAERKLLRGRYKQRSHCDATITTIGYLI